MRSLFATCAASVALAILQANIALATTLYTVDVNSGKLLLVSSATGGASIVGVVGFSGVSGLAFDSPGVLYGYDATSRNLLSINTGTGAGTAINVVLGDRLNDIAIDPTTGTLYGIATHENPDTRSVNDFLVTISKTTAALLSTPVLTATTGVDALTFSPAGTLYGKSNSDGKLFTIDPNTGVVTEIGAVRIGPVGVSTNVQGMAWGSLFGVASGGDLGTSPDSHLISIDPTTGLSTDIGLLGVGIFAQSLAAQPEAVPEPATWALLGASAAGALLRRRARGRA